jgi:hypothetical protein
MSDSWLRGVVMLATVLLVLHAVGAWAYSALGVAAAIVSAVLVGAVSIFSARMAGKGNNAWFVVPTIVFTAVPLAAGLWRLFAVEQSWWTRAVELTPFLTGFAAPVLLLLMAYLNWGGAKLFRLIRSCNEQIEAIPGALRGLFAIAPCVCKRRGHDHPRCDADLGKRTVDEIAQFQQAVLEHGAGRSHQADVSDLEGIEGPERGIEQPALLVRQAAQAVMQGLRTFGGTG